MKRIALLLFFIALFTLCALTFTSCDSALEKPTELYLEVETQTLRWEKVSGARSYTVKVSNGMPESIVVEANYPLDYLAPGKYVVQVKANGDGEAINDSGWVRFDYERQVESGLEYMLNESGTEYRLIGPGTAEGDVVMEAVYRGKPVTSIADKAIYNDTKITSFTVGENVKTIGEKAFTKCALLTSVTVPDGVVSIGEYAFQSCNVLTEITLPNTVKVINPHTFAWCSALAKVTLGNEITSIGEYAFANCEALKEINYSGNIAGVYEANLPDTLQTVSQYAFTDCLALASIDIGDGVTDIENGAFMGCKALANVNLGTSLNRLGEEAFRYCESLTSVSIPDSTEIIEKWCFVSCTKLEDVSFGTGLKEIGTQVFFYTAIRDAATDVFAIDGWLIEIKNLANPSFTIPNGVYGIASYAASENTVIQQADLRGVKYVCTAAFEKCPALYKATFDDSLLSIGKAAFYECVFLDTVIVGKSLENVDDYAFFGCEKLTDMNEEGTKGITLPDSVTRVGLQAFRNTKACSDVSKSQAGGGVVYIGKWAVDYVPQKDIFADIVIKDGTRAISNYAFASQSGVNVIISDSVEYIGRGAFYKGFYVFMNLPANLKHIDDYAFYGCSSTSFGGEYYTLEIPDGTHTIGRSAFYGCISILSLKIPGSVVSIGDYAFFDCQNIGATLELEISTGEFDEDEEPIMEIQTVTGEFELANGIKTIGKRAFKDCLSLVNVTIPDSVTYIGELAFYNCPELKSISIGSGVTEISDHMFYDSEALQTVIIRGNLEKIGNAAFANCTSLKSVQICGAKKLGDFVFYGCSALEAIVLPNDLVSIGKMAFRNCNLLTSLTVPAGVSEISEHAFYNSNTNSLTIYAESAGAQDGWSKLFNSSNRPVVFGCELSETKDYVVSVTGGNIANANAINGVGAPVRAGYEFAGWGTVAGSDEVVYTSENIGEAAPDVRLYAVWREPSDDNITGE